MTNTDHYYEPIGNSGDQKYACILRNSSGRDKGDVDYVIRDFSSLPMDHQLMIARTARELADDIDRMVRRNLELTE